ncbi:MAG: hypothetical protein E7178_04850 [Erysipelotrichaceae bacterium]|nr:hypothetical protein [Erysipelotrichaceae bacterium]
MGKLYEKIRKDIEKLKTIDEAIKNKELVSMDDIFETSIALKKIQYVCVYCEQKNKELFEGEGRFPFGEMENFNIPENFETLVDNWEEHLNENEINEAVRHLDLQDKAEPYIPELAEYDPDEYFNYVRDTLDDICSVSSKGHFGISREGIVSLSISAHQEFVKTCKQEDFTFESYSNAKEEILDFVYNPIESVVNRNGDELLLDYGTMRDNFIRDHTKEFDDVLKEQGYNSVRQHYDAFNDRYVPVTALSKIAQAEWKAEPLADGLKSAITIYDELIKTNKGRFPSIGEFISEARDRVESTVLNKVIPLKDDDPNCKFLKDFLKDPISTLENHFRNDMRYKDLADKIHNERDNYNNARKDKVDLYANIEIARQSRFESLFNRNNPNFDPATFKTTYQGSTFERFLGRTSPEWTALSDYVDSWKNDINNPRDLNRAGTLAENYLRHKFPGVDPKDVTIDMVRGLRGAGKERGMFCLSIVNAKAQANDEIDQDIYDNAKRQFDELDKRRHRGLSFSDQLSNDINDNEISNKNDNEIENNNIIKNDIELN